MRVLLVICLLSLSTGPAVLAQALTSDTFDSAVTGWDFAPGTVLWSSADSSGRSSSGSAKLINMLPGAGDSVKISRCVPVTPPVNTFVAAARFRLGAGVTGGAEGRLHLTYFISPDCTTLDAGDADLRGLAGVGSSWGRGLWAFSLGGSLPNLIHSVELELVLVKSAAGGVVSGHFDDLLFGVNATASLVQDRFFVGTAWKTATGEIGLGSPVEVTTDSAYFWFFAPTNVEMIVKVIDGCNFNHRYWAFAGGLTNVETYWTVVDTTGGGGTRWYLNPQGKAFLPVQDTNALFGCP